MQDWLMLILTAGAVFTDLKERKIKNSWIGLGIILGIGCRGYQDGWNGIGEALIGILIPVMILWGAFCAHKIGAGDVKLFAVLGSFLGIGRILECMMTAMVFGLACVLIRMGIGRRKPVIRLSIPIFCSVLCGIGGFY